MRAALVALVVFAALTGVVHRRLLVPLDRSIYAAPATSPDDGPPVGRFARGDQLLHVWALAVNLRHLRHDRRALFDANSFYPMRRSLFFSDHLFGQALVAWPLAAVTRNPVLVHNLLLLLAFVLSGAGLALLVKRLTGSLLAGIVAGIGWVSSPPRSFEIFQLQLLTTQWIPFLFLSLHAAAAAPRVAPAVAATAALLGLQLLSGIYVGAYLVLCLVPFVVVRLLTLPPRRRWAFGCHALAAGVLGGLAAAPWFREYLHVRGALGEYGGLLENVAYSLSLQHWILPSWVLGAERFPGIVGVTLLVLALIGVVAPAGPAGRERWAYAATAVWAAALSLGPYVRYGAGPETSSGPAFLGRGPYAVLYDLLPGLDALRVPARMTLLAGFFAWVVAGLGAARLLASIRRPVTRVAVAALLAAAILLESRPRAPAVEILAVGEDVPPVYRWLRDQGAAGAVVELPMNVLADPQYLYYSTVHWRPIVNGYGAHLPAFQLYVQAELSRFPDPDAVEVLRAMAVRYVITHDRPAAPLGERADLYVAAVLGSDTVYEVAPAVAPADRRAPSATRDLPRAGWRAASGSNPADVGLAFDGDPRTAWSNVGDLTRDLLGSGGGGLAWLRALESWEAYRRAYRLEGREESFTLDLGETVAPAGVEILLRAHQSPVFAPFLLAVSADGARWTRIACPWRPAATLLEYAERPADTWLETSCEVPPTRFLRVTQRPATLRVYWELAEIRVRVPPR
jgi:hypothetical protein